MNATREIDERISKCEKILSANPGSQIFAALAEAHRKKGSLDEAFAVCQKGLKSHPKYGSAHVVMAKINIDKGLFDWAESEVEKAAKLGANVHAIETLKCEILVSQGDTDQAIVRIEKQLKLDPQNDHLKRLLKRAKSPKAKAAFPSMADQAAARGRISPKPDPFSGSASGGIKPAAVVTRPTSVVADPLASESTQAKKVESLSISGVIEEIFAVEGVYAGFLLAADGSAVESRWDGIGAEDEHIVFASTTASQCRDALERMPLGTWNVILVDTPRLALFLVSNGDELLAFYAGEQANRNRMRVAINRAVGRYEDRKIEQGA
jgi:tetratricopeptide (TPR) repeat protein